jgi:hypothetical protein
MPGVLTVGGVNREGIASDSASSQGITIGVMAPSEGLVGASPGNSYVTWSGTSGATPIVSGIVALVRAAYPELDAANVINRILVTARAQTELTPDPLYGFGLVDAYAALTADVPLVSANPLGSIDDWVVIHRRQEGEPIVIPLGSTPAPVEEEALAPTPPGLVVDTARISLPWVVSGIFGVAFMSVVISGAILVLSRLKNR